MSHLTQTSRYQFTPHHLETEPPVSPDYRTIRAARSLYTNRQRLTIVQDRIERAQGTLLSYLGLYGLAATVIGGFEVTLTGDQLNLTHLDLPGVHQLPLPDPDPEWGSVAHAGGDV